MKSLPVNSSGVEFAPVCTPVRCPRCRNENFACELAVKETSLVVKGHTVNVLEWQGTLLYQQKAIYLTCFREDRAVRGACTGASRNVPVMYRYHDISPRRRHSHSMPYASPSISAARGTSPAKVRPPIRRHDGAPRLISPSISSTQHIPFPHVTRNTKMERHALGSFTPPWPLALAPSSSFPLLPLGMIAPSLPARSSHNGRTSGAHNRGALAPDEGGHRTQSDALIRGGARQ